MGSCNSSVSVTDFCPHNVGGGKGRCGGDKQLEMIQYLLVDVKYLERGKPEWDWSVVLNRVMGVGSQAGVWGRAFGAEGKGQRS